jgi:hypothetical protein
MQTSSYGLAHFILVKEGLADKLSTVLLLRNTEIIFTSLVILDKCSDANLMQCSGRQIRGAVRKP